LSALETVAIDTLAFFAICFIVGVIIFSNNNKLYNSIHLLSLALHKQLSYLAYYSFFNVISKISKITELK